MSVAFSLLTVEYPNKCSRARDGFLNDVTNLNMINNQIKSF